MGESVRKGDLGLKGNTVGQVNAALHPGHTTQRNGAGLATAMWVLPSQLVHRKEVADGAAPQIHPHRWVGPGSDLWGWGSAQAPPSTFPPPESPFLPPSEHLQTSHANNAFAFPKLRAGEKADEEGALGSRPPPHSELSGPGGCEQMGGSGCAGLEISRPEVPLGPMWEEMKGPPRHLKTSQNAQNETMPSSPVLLGWTLRHLQGPGLPRGPDHLQEEEGGRAGQLPPFSPDSSPRTGHITGPRTRPGRLPTESTRDTGAAALLGGPAHA